MCTIHRWVDERISLALVARAWGCLPVQHFISTGLLVLLCRAVLCVGVLVR